MYPVLVLLPIEVASDVRLYENGLLPDYDPPEPLIDVAIDKLLHVDELPPPNKSHL